MANIAYSPSTSALQLPAVQLLAPAARDGQDALPWMKVLKIAADVLASQGWTREDIAAYLRDARH